MSLNPNLRPKPLPVNQEHIEPAQELLKYLNNHTWEEPLFKTLVEIAPIGITLSASDRQLAYCNRAFADIVGYTQEELYRIDWNQLTYEEDRKGNLSILDEFLVGKISSSEFEKRYWHKAGHLVWCRLTVTQLHDLRSEEPMFLALIKDITEEKVLAESLNRKESIIEMGEKVASTGTFIWNIETNEMEASPGVLSIFELDPETTTPQNLFERATLLIHPDDVEPLFQGVIQSTQAKTPTVFQYRIKFPDGRIKWVRTNPGPYLDDIRMLRTIQDVTKDMAQTQLLTQQRNFIEIGEKTAGLGTFIWDVKTNQVTASPGYYAVYGLDPNSYDRDNIMAKVISLTHTEDRDRLRKNISTITANKAPSPIDYRVVLDSGEIKWIRVSAGRFINETEKLGTVQDITEEKNNTLALLQQEEMVRIGGEVGNIGVDIFDKETESFIYSPHLLKMFQLDPNEVNPENLGLTLVNLCHPDDREIVHQFTQTLIENPDERVEIIHRAILPNKEIRWMQVISDRFKDTTSRITINKDITEYVLQSEKLKTSQKEIEQLLYSVSHDLRAPLRHINSYAQMLEMSASSKLDDREVRNLQNVLSASKRLGFMIDELLQFFRNNQVAITSTTVDLAALTHAAKALFSQDTEQRNIQWSIGPLPTVKGDRDMLEKVLQNLLSNAVKFTSRTPEARIDISAEASSQEGMVQIKVQDNGAGFNMKYADKLFAVFQRLHTRRQFEGTGIGLANVRRILEKHGGTIWAESEPGQGATFYFTLPRSSATD